MTFAAETRGLTKRMGWMNPVTILDGVNLVLEEGKVLGLLGPNGAGKTTTFKLLLGLSRITTGIAFLFGIPVPHPSSRAKVGFLPEVVNHPDYLTVEEYLFYHGQLAGQSDLSNRMREALKKVGMESAGPYHLGILSKGMRQRIDLARVIMLDSRLVFLDEPVSGLDPLGQATLKEILGELKANGISLFINSHSVGILSDICDHIGILHQGRMVKYGTLHELLTTNRFRLLIGFSGENPLSLLSGRNSEDKSIPLPDGQYLLDLVGRQDLSESIRQLSEKGAKILEAAPVRLTLDQLFSMTLGIQPTKLTIETSEA